MVNQVSCKQEDISIRVEYFFEFATNKIWLKRDDTFSPTLFSSILDLTLGVLGSLAPKFYSQPIRLHNFGVCWSWTRLLFRVN